MVDANQIVGRHDILFMTLDTLRYDVAVQTLERNELPNFASVLPDEGWQLRHSPGSFTLAAHQAFFAGFLPTPAGPGPHPRLFAAKFQGSESTTPESYVYDSPTWVQGLSEAGYRTVCIGGVGFFNKQTALGRVLPDLFDESHWSPNMGVTSRTSAAEQFSLAARIVNDAPPDRHILMFINVSAVHQPNCMYADSEEDSPETQSAALTYVDSCLPTLFDALRSRGPTFCIVCSDHGTAYGESGYHGHRLGHPVVWDVPYAEFFLK